MRVALVALALELLLLLAKPPVEVEPSSAPLSWLTPSSAPLT
jgi:hypothetical protein